MHSYTNASTNSNCTTA